MKKLKTLAESLGCTVEDDRDNATLYIYAPEGKAWEGGTLSLLCHSYGSMGSYLPAWRQEAIQDAIERLSEMGRPEDDAEDA